MTEAGVWVSQTFVSGETGTAVAGTKVYRQLWWIFLGVETKPHYVERLDVGELVARAQVNSS